MKQVNISQLMDEYEDNEFFPEGGSCADTQAVKDRVLAQAAPAKRRWKPKLKAALLAAALGVVGLLCIAATVGGPVVHYLSGATYENNTLGGPELVSPVLVEDDRVWFVADGQHLDITDLIDAETPYIYTYTDPETNATTYTVVGGDMDDLGWFEYALFYDYGEDCEKNAPFRALGGTVGENYFTDYVSIHGEVYAWEDLDPEQPEYQELSAYEGLIPEPGEGKCDYYVWREDRPWVTAANEALAGIDCFH